MALKQGILVIDLDDSFLTMLENSLSGDYNFFSCSNAIMMYQILELEAISLLILDYNLSSTHSGLEIAINVKQNYPFVKIVMVTSYVSYELIKAAINSSAIDSFLEKPVVKEELMKIIESNLKKSVTEFTDFQKIIERIKKKESITPEMIASFGSELKLLDMLYKESIRSFPQNKHNVIGISIFKNNQVFLQKFLDSEFIIENEFLFSSFLMTLEMLSEKFKSEGRATQEIEFEDMHLWVMRVNLYTFVFFLNKKNGNRRINIRLLKNKAYSIYDKLVENEFIWLNENLGDMIYQLNEKLMS